MSKHFNSKNVALYPVIKLICHMINDTVRDLLVNYRTLVSRLDELCRNISGEFQEAINCRPGCSACCRHLTIFPVEAAALLESLQKHPSDLSYLLPDSDLPEDGPCPFLKDNLCAAYQDRPIICRTHGLPILTGTGEEKTIDYCPENFQGIKSIHGSAILNIDVINQTLVAINARFVHETDDSRFREKERFSLAQVIRLALENK